MIIGVAGPYSAISEEQRNKNFEAMNIAAARIYELGHIPFIGLNMALPILAHAKVEDKYEAVMKISLAVINKCDAILLLAESPGASRESDLIRAKNLPIFHSLSEIPNNN